MGLMTTACKKYLFLFFRTVTLLSLLGGIAAAEPAPSDYSPVTSYDKPVIVGGDRAYPPYEFIDKDGQPAGYNVDLTKAIAEVMGMKVEFRFGAWSDMRSGLKQGTINIPMSGPIRSTFLPPIPLFTMPFLPAGIHRRSVPWKSCGARRSLSFVTASCMRS